ncbi:MAG: GAF domain-containing protein [Magnetococcales bacterium]|nr:GAF domain-containing protein [Magnetococcales bacterium]
MLNIRSISFSGPNRQIFYLFVFLIPLLFFAAFFLTPSATAGKGEKEAANVLYINSYHRGYSWSDAIERNLMEGLDAFDKKIELSIEYLDSRRFDNPERLSQLADMMVAKYGDYHLNIVVTSDNAAFDFAVANRERLFPDIPIVFCGYNNLRHKILEGIPKITGVNEEVDLSGTINLALSVHPDTRTLAFIVSTSDHSSHRILEIAKESVFPHYTDHYDVVLLKDLSILEIRNRLNQLPKETIVFISGQTSDRKKGRALSPVENSTLIATNSPFPTYGFWEFNLGTGVLGGSIVTGADQGRAAAQMVTQILSGTPVDAIPPFMKSPTSLTFDYQVMKQFGIGENRLPPKAIFLNRPDSLWENYKWYIIGGIGAILFEAILIIALYYAVRQRKKALDQSQEFLELAQQSQGELQILTKELEQRVEERTAELRSKQAILSLIERLRASFISNPDPFIMYSDLLEQIKEISESPYGFIGETLTTTDGKTYLKAFALTNLSWNDESERLYREFENRGFEFHTMESLFGKVITSGKPVISNDPENDTRATGTPSGHPKLMAFLGVPIYFGDKLVGEVGLANRPGGYEQRLLEYLNPLFNALGHIINARQSLQEREEARKVLEEKAQMLEEKAQILEENIWLREEVEHITRHDLKTPLNAIIGLPDVLLEGDNLHSDQRELIHQIQKTGYRMLDQINRSLDIYRMEQGRYELSPEPIKLEPLLYRIQTELESLGKKRGIRIIIQCEKNVVVMGEELLLFSLFANLIKNALEAAPKGSSVTVSSSRKSVQIVDIHNMGAVPEAIRNRFFDKFITAGKSGGTGLGTYSARLITETLGGNIAMQSSDEKGTTVTVSLDSAVVATYS